MSSAMLVKQCGIDNYQWTLIGGNSQDVQTGDGEALAQACAVDCELIFIAPAESVSLCDVDFEAHEKKMLQQTIPFTLEDDLLEDINDLHFSLGEIQQQTVTVAWVKNCLLDQWLDNFQQLGLLVKQVLPEIVLLPNQENTWTLIIDDDRWLLKSGKFQGFSLEAINASLALQLLLDAAEQLPEALHVHAGNHDQDSILVRLPEMLRGIVQWAETDYWDIVCNVCDNPTSPASNVQLNLLQGRYERKLPWRQWWMIWRVAAVLLLSVVVLQFIATYSQLKSLENTNLELRTQIEQEYRSVIPRGSMINPAKKLARKIAALESGGGGVIVLLDRVAQVLAQSEGINILSLNYTEKQSEIRLTVIAPSFENVETARANMEEIGLTAELTGSNSDNGKTRAQLRIKS